MLDIECFSFLNSALESPLSPLVIMATNRGITKIRGTNDKSPHGIPFDFLERLVIIATSPYSEEEMRQILEIRCIEEDVDMTDTAKDLLSTVATQTSLRYAIQLITSSHIVSKRRKAPKVDVEDIQKVYGLFWDEKRSMEYLKAHQEQFLFNTLGSNDTDMEQ